MNGIHDMGGMQGFGPVEPEANEPVFHHTWEGRALALNRAMGYARLWNIDMSRAAIEKMPPDLYLTRSYYAKWLLRLWGFVLEHAIGFAIIIIAAVGLAIRAIVRRIVRAVRSRRSGT